MARLPLEEHIQINSRKVITVNQVFEILVRVASATNSNSSVSAETSTSSSASSTSVPSKSVWVDAFDAVIPQRKKKHTDDDEDDGIVSEPPAKKQKLEPKVEQSKEDPEVFPEDDGEGDYDDGDAADDQ